MLLEAVLDLGAAELHTRPDLESMHRTDRAAVNVREDKSVRLSLARHPDDRAVGSVVPNHDVVRGLLLPVQRQ